MAVYPTMDVCIYPTSVRFKMQDPYTLENGMRIGEFVNSLTEFKYDYDRRRWRRDRQYIVYEESKQVCSIPRYYLKDIVNYIRYYEGDVNMIHAPINPGRDVKFKLNSHWKLRENQVGPVEFLIDPKFQHRMRALPIITGCGKGHPKDTFIKIPNGWKQLGDIRIGDEIIAADGTITIIDGIFPKGKQKIYKITFWDGRSVETDGDHIWKVFDCIHARDVNDKYDNGWGLITTNDIFDIKMNPEKQHANRIRLRDLYVPLVIPEQGTDIDLPIDPYTLGVLLGDGHLGSTAILIHSDLEVIKKVWNNNFDHLRMTISKDSRNHMEYYRYARLRQDIDGSFPIRDSLYKFNLIGKHSWDKFIPEIYLNASFKQRLELIQGLMDTDGSVYTPDIKNNGHHGSIEFCTTSKIMAKQVQYLIRSIGGIVKLSIKQFPKYTYNGETRIGRPAYRLAIRHPKPSILFTLKRKQQFINDNNQYSYRLKLRIRDIEYVGEKETICISVKHPDHLYVVNDFIVTHNTIMSIYAAAKLNKPFIVIVGGLIEQWYDVIAIGKKNKYPVLDLNEDDIYVIQGQDSLINLVENKKYKPKVILGSLSTIRNYITADHYPYTELPNFNELMFRLGVGTKINDEAHRCFATIVDIDLRCNIANNFYLSATLTRGDKQSKKIFMKVFPELIRYQAPEPVKYQTIYYIPYHIGFFKENKIISKRYGYNQNKYENQILNDLFKKLAFLQFVHNQVEAYYINIKNPGEKCLIMASTRNMCDAMLEYFKGEYPNLKINSFYENDSDENTVDVDIIIATTGKASTGNDIKELRTLINTISIGSEVLPVQILGRLRQLDKGRIPIYVAMYNKAVDAHIRHYKFCRTIYRSRALHYYDLSDKDIW